MFTVYHRFGERRYQERYGLGFQDFAVGQRFRIDAAVRRHARRPAIGRLSHRFSH